MDAKRRIEQTLVAALANAQSSACPPRLAAALRYAVFPGGARVRPRLCLAVAAACGERDSPLADAAGAAIELLHCASLVHDDLPCFDDAPTRRGKPSVHRAFGERIAVLTGDALIVLAFETLANAAHHAPARLAPLVATVAASVGAPSGLAAGQAWECEPRVPLAEYQRAKTGALFAAATAAGAQATGADPTQWRILGERLGESYQVADDIRDAAGVEEDLGKPVGRDRALGRPSSALELGVVGAIRHFEDLVQQAMDAVPDCAGAHQLRALIMLEAQRLLPKEIAQLAA